MSPASRTCCNLDLLLIETADSNSALIRNSVVAFFSFLFSQINSSPMARMVTVGSRKVSSAVNSNLSDLSMVKC